MLRCHRCGGAAQAGLAHLHGDPSRPLCPSCTNKVLAERYMLEKVRTFLRQIRSVRQDRQAA